MSQPTTITTVLESLSCFKGKCSVCGREETRFETVESQWASWPCVCGWFMVAPNTITWN